MTDYSAPIDRIGSNYTPSAKSLTMGRAKQISHSLEIQGDREKRQQQMRKRKDQGTTVMHVMAPAASASTAHLKQFVQAELKTLKPGRGFLPPTAEDEEGEEGDQAEPPVAKPTEAGLMRRAVSLPEGVKAEDIMTPHAQRVRARVERHVTNTLEVSTATH